MTSKIKCPDCEKTFSVKENLKYRVRFNWSFIKLALRNMWIDGLEEIYKPHIVVCPNCGNEFSTKDYKYFSFFEPIHLQVGLIIVFLFFIFAPLAVVFWQVLK